MPANPRCREKSTAAAQKVVSRWNRVPIPPASLAESCAARPIPAGKPHAAQAPLLMLQMPPPAPGIPAPTSQHAALAIAHRGNTNPQPCAALPRKSALSPEPHPDKPQPSTATATPQNEPRPRNPVRVARDNHGEESDCANGVLAAKGQICQPEQALVPAAKAASPQSNWQRLASQQRSMGWA